jgi:hypothetical protein
MLLMKIDVLSVCILLNIHVRFFIWRLPPYDAAIRERSGLVVRFTVARLSLAQTAPASVRCRCLHDRAGTQPTGSLIAT